MYGIVTMNNRPLWHRKDIVFWTKMIHDVENWNKACPRCVLNNGAPQNQAPLVLVRTSMPLELVAMDYLKMDCSIGGLQNILVITNHFTKFAWVIPTPDRTAITTANVLWQHLFQPFGTFRRLHSDQRACFNAQVIKELCSLFGTVKSQTTPYHPAGNGVCERFNRTLGTLEEDKKETWPDHVGELVFMYNNAVHSSTAFTPFHLIFGRHSRLPNDVKLGLSPSEEGLHLKQCTHSIVFVQTDDNALKISCPHLVPREQNTRLC